MYVCVCHNFPDVLFDLISECKSALKSVFKFKWVYTAN